MKRIVCRMLWVMALMFAGGWAQAAITCSVSSPGFMAFYLSTNPINITQSSFTVSCTRTSLADAGSVTYNVGVDNGLHAVANPNQAWLGGGGGASTITYDTYKDSGCTTLWRKSGGNLLSGTITFAGTGTFTQSLPWWGCVPSGQAGKNAGVFTDIVTMTLAISSGTVIGAFTFPVSISNPANCTISPAPGNVTFNYTSFTATPSTASTTFGATCTNSMPYTMALDTYSGTLLGLNYTLALNAGTLNMTGTGAVQTISINGTIAAGQSGTCATATCFGSQGHTLTITY